MPTEAIPPQIMVVSMPTMYRGNMSKKLHQQEHRSVQTL